MNQDEGAISEVLGRFREALIRSDAEALINMYAADGVAMGEGAPSNVGVGAIGKAYHATLGNVSLNVVFNIEEIHQVAPDWAFARTNSTGTMTVRADGKSFPESNQELFVFQRVGGGWKIARYCFATTLATQ
jgi:uncharacterized protein (TIGR02246 family)